MKRVDYIVLPVLLLSSCIVGAESPGTLPGNNALTEDECKEFALSIEKSVFEGDSSILLDRIDWAQIEEKSAKGVDISGQQKTAFFNGLITKVGKMGDIITNAGKPPASYKFLRGRMSNGDYDVIFRLLPTGAGVNYHEFKLKRVNGKIMIVDLFMYNIGNWTSAIFRRNLIHVIADKPSGLTETLTLADRDYAKHMVEIGHMAECANTGKPTEALEIYKQLPESLKADKDLLLIRYRCGAALKGQEYVDAITALKTAFPDDPSMNMILIDYYFLKKDYENAMAAVNMLDKSIGGDPYQQFMRGSIQMQAGNLAEARKFMAQAINDEPTLKTAYWGMVSVSLKNKEFEETVHNLELIQKKFHVRIADLTKLPLYADFVKSNEYQNWIAGQKTQKDAAKAP